jgi:integrase
MAKPTARRYKNERGIQDIKDERPQSTCDKLFLRKRSPFTPIASSGAVYPIIKTAISKAGIALTGRCCGTRLLRHNAASAMLAKGFDVPTIAAVLGHADPMSVAAYITTDHEGLARCILPMVGMEVPS